MILSRTFGPVSGLALGAAIIPTTLSINSADAQSVEFNGQITNYTDINNNSGTTNVPFTVSFDLTTFPTFVADEDPGTGVEYDFDTIVNLNLNAMGPMFIETPYSNGPWTSQASYPAHIDFTQRSNGTGDIFVRMDNVLSYDTSNPDPLSNTFEGDHLFTLFWYNPNTMTDPTNPAQAMQDFAENYNPIGSTPNFAFYNIYDPDNLNYALSASSLTASYEAPPCSADLNGDGVFDTADIGIFVLQCPSGLEGPDKLRLTGDILVYVNNPYGSGDPVNQTFDLTFDLPNDDADFETLITTSTSETVTQKIEGQFVGLDFETDEVYVGMPPYNTDTPWGSNANVPTTITLSSPTANDNEIFKIVTSYAAASSDSGQETTNLLYVITFGGQGTAGGDDLTSPWGVIQELDNAYDGVNLPTDYTGLLEFSESNGSPHLVSALIRNVEVVNEPCINDLNGDGVFDTADIALFVPGCP